MYLHNNFCTKSSHNIVEEGVEKLPRVRGHGGGSEIVLTLKQLTCSLFIIYKEFKVLKIVVARDCPDKM